MLRKVRNLGLIMLAAVLVIVMAACGKKEEAPAGDKGAAPAKTGEKKEISLNAAGSSFINPLFQKMFSEYSKQHSEVKVNYQSIGSGGGQKQLGEGTIDFAASDAFMTDDKISAVKNGVIHIPMTIGAVAVIYNIEGVDKGVKLTQETLSDIYLGKIKKWNDPKIAQENADKKFPDLAITVVGRSDGSGTTDIFTDYLSTVSPDWKTQVGKGTSVKWPVGIAAKGNEGVAGQVKQTPGGIGYVELAYAEKNKITYAQLRNKDGKFTYPSLEAASLAAADAGKNMPEDTRTSLVEKSGEKAYGIVGMTWVLVNSKYEDADKKKAIVDLIKWGYRDGQQYSEALLYAKLPEEIAKINDKNLAKIQ